jgi:hypothetical protein
MCDDPRASARGPGRVIHRIFLPRNLLCSYKNLLSTFAFIFNQRRYTAGIIEAVCTMILVGLSLDYVLHMVRRCQLTLSKLPWKRLELSA